MRTVEYKEDRGEEEERKKNRRDGGRGGGKDPFVSKSSVHGKS
jgi:hypothetical protein